MKWILIMFTAYVPNVDSRLQEIEMRNEESCRSTVQYHEQKMKEDPNYIFRGRCEEK